MPTIRIDSLRLIGGLPSPAPVALALAPTRAPLTRTPNITPVALPRAATLAGRAYRLRRRRPHRQRERRR